MENISHKRRILLTLVFVSFIAIVLIFNVTRLHFSRKVIVQNKNDTIKRGDIVDVNGYPLALSVYKYSIYADPRKVDNPEEVAQKLSSVITIPYDELKDLLTRDKHFVWIKRKIDDAILQQVKQLSLPGIYYKKEYARVYPEGSMAAQVLGFVNIDNIGLEGIEYKYNDILLSGDSSWNEENKGLTVQLTLDREIQYIAQKTLNAYSEQVMPQRGIALVLEIKTGKILGLATYPQFDPETFYNYDKSILTCFSVVDSFEPGSTMKLFAAITLLEHLPDALQKTFICKGSIDVFDATIKCTKEHGRVNLNDIITYSCNAGIIQAMQYVKKDYFYQTLVRFGFGEKTGIQLSGESSGILRPPQTWSGLSKFSMAIGQELSVTSVQLASAIAAIANKGIYMYPQIVNQIKNTNGNVVSAFFPRSKGKILNEHIAQTILLMMRNVVIEGTGKRAYVAGYGTGGKTGTAQKSTPQGGYIPNAYVVSFIGIAPLENPDICVLILFDEPHDGGSGGELAAPVFSDIVKRVLPLRGFGRETVKQQSPSQVAYKKKKSMYVPNFIGYKDTEALRELINIQQNYPIQYIMKGSGTVVSQNPQPGLPLTNVTTISLTLE
ncbi:MAG TPA: penicillin-binding transpeptidase domain-containing protein [Spirochaetota bacterium]|nr:penicillin-binding transpeptidase domain-containing protein [Spirochaetota bacterium]